MEPSNEDQDIKAERDGALGTRWIELGFDLQESRESNEEGQAGSGGARCACGEEQSSTYIKDRKAGGMQRDSRRFYFLPNQPHMHSGGFPFQPMSSGALGRNHPGVPRCRHGIESPAHQLSAALYCLQKATTFYYWTLKFALNLLHPSPGATNFFCKR